MAFVGSLKKFGISVLESHPLGYMTGVFLLDHLDLLLPHESDYFGFEELARRGHGRNRVILDVGANRGHSARAFLKLLPGWDVFSIEANPMHETSLGKIRERSKGRFSYVIAAAGEKSGENVILFTPSYHGIALHSATSSSREEALGAVESAYPGLKGRFALKETNSLSLSIDELAISADFVKLDIQGAEQAALRGMSRTIERFKPILLVEQNSLSHEISEMLEHAYYHPWSFDAESKHFSKGVRRGTYGHGNTFFAADVHERLLASAQV